MYASNYLALPAWADEWQFWAAFAATLAGGFAAVWTKVMHPYVGRRREARQLARQKKEERRRYASLVWSGWGPIDDTITQGCQYGAVVRNESGTALRTGKVTVIHARDNWEVKKEIGFVQPGTLKWPGPEIYREAGNGTPGQDRPERPWEDVAAHDVEVTFRDRNGLWLRTGDELVELEQRLVIWAEETRAQTLRAHITGERGFAPEYLVDVRIESFDNTEQLQKAFGDLRAGRPLPSEVEPPDVVVGPHDWLGWVIAEDAVEPVVFSSDEQNSFEPNALKAVRRGKNLYAIPYVLDTVALIRNTALTGPGPMPARISEVISRGWAALDAHDVVDGTPLALQVGSGDPYHMWPLFASVGGSFFGLTEEGRPTPPEHWRDEFIRAFGRIAELGMGPGGEGVLSPDVERKGDRGALSLFLRGGAPFLICSSRALSSIVDADMTIDVAAVPRLGDRPARPMVSVYGFYIYKRARNKRIAQDLVTSYMARTDTGERLNEIQPLVPVQRRAMSRIKHRNPVVRPYVNQCERGLLMPAMPQVRAAWDILGATERAVLAGRGNPWEIAAQAADDGWRIVSQTD